MGVNNVLFTPAARKKFWIYLMFFSTNNSFITTIIFLLLYPLNILDLWSTYLTPSAAEKLKLKLIKPIIVQPETL